MPDDKKSLSYRVWMVVDSDQFEYFIMSLIVLNTLQLMMKVRFKLTQGLYKRLCQFLELVEEEEVVAVVVVVVQLCVCLYVCLLYDRVCATAHNNSS